MGLVSVEGPPGGARVKNTGVNYFGKGHQQCFSVCQVGVTGGW